MDIKTNREILSTKSNEELGDFIYIHFKRFANMCNVAGLKLEDIPRDDFVAMIVGVLSQEIDLDEGLEEDD